jgi:hypothetical protein
VESRLNKAWVGAGSAQAAGARDDAKEKITAKLINFTHFTHCVIPNIFEKLNEKLSLNLTY